MTPSRWRAISSSLDMASFVDPPDSTAEGFMAALMAILCHLTNWSFSCVSAMASLMAPCEEERSATKVLFWDVALDFSSAEGLEWEK